MDFEPGIGNRKSVRGEVVFQGFLRIRVFDLRDRLSEYAFEYCESNGYNAGVHLN